MARDVGHGLLHDAKAGSLDVAGQARLVAYVVKAQPQSGASRALFAQPLQRRRQPQVVEHRRAQRRRQAAYLLDGILDDANGFALQLRQRLRLLQPFAQLQVDLDGREQLPQFVVQLHGDAAALLLLHLQHALRQRLELARGRLQPLLGLVLVQGHGQRGAQFTFGKRLEDVAEGLGELRALQKLFGRIGREKHHRYLLLRAQQFRHRNAVERAIDLYVHQHQIGPLRTRQLQGRFAVAGYADGLVAQRFKLFSDVARNDGLVLHHQDSRPPVCCLHLAPLIRFDNHDPSVVIHVNIS